MSVATAIRRRGPQGDARRPLKVGFFHLVWLFLLASFVGLIAEVLVSYIADGRWESRAGFVIGPLSPLYGCGAVLMTLAVNPLRGRAVPIQFLAAGLLGGALEYFAGWFFESRFGIVAWSYIDQPLNFHGHTSAFMMIVWGAVGVAWANWALPVAMRAVETIPQGVRRPLTALALAFIVCDSALTLACLDCWFLREAGAPVSNPLQQFFAAYFGDDFMRSRFETMGMWPVLADRPLP